jgi:predicted AlkP superfamily pyrophosphatase or phosphodiesterase
MKIQGSEPVRRPLRARGLLAASIAIAAAGCGGAHYVRLDPVVPASPVPERRGVTNHVVLISIDGLRPDAIGHGETPTLTRLVQDGSFTLAATTILPSKTLPSHTSMLTGEPPDRHGVLWNSNQTGTRGTVEQPTVFSVLKASGHHTAAFFSKSKFQHLQRPGTLDYSQAPGGWFGRWDGTRTAGDVERYLSNARPDLLFVHLSDPDAAGHRAGWMSPAYKRAVRLADGSVERILAAAERAFGAGAYTVIVTADHGGHDRDHGSSDPRDVTIPWIAWGRGVRRGELGSAAHVRTMDTASTVLWLLGVREPGDWMGAPVTTAFQELNEDAQGAASTLPHLNDPKR